ncbi:hypothetical protein V8E51_010259 [Hyaloscypha variabilis]
MYLLLPYLTVILIIFIFITVILINVGGIDPSTDSHNYLAPEGNKAFNLVNCGIIASLRNSRFPPTNYNLHLNRFCIGTRSIYLDTIQDTCQNGRIVTKVMDCRQLPAPNALVGAVAPFRFSTVNLNIPFAFFILTAIFAFCLLLATLIGAGTKGSKGKIVASMLSGMTLCCTFAALVAITVQMVRLKNQVEHNTIDSVVISTWLATLVDSATARYDIEFRNFSLGGTVLGLTWASTILMLVDTVTWGLAWGHSGKERLAEPKEEKYMQG